MYTVSTNLKTALENQPILMKVTAQDTVFDGNSIKSIRYTASCCSSNIGIGNVSAATIEIELDGVYSLLDAEITVQVGAEVDGTTQYIPLGTFVITECSATEDTTTLTGYDAAYYAMAGAYEPTVASGATVSQVVADIAAQCGLELDSSYAFDGTATVNGDLTGRTCREMLGLMAMLVGRNVVISRDGKIRLVWFQSANTKITPDEYYEGEYTNGGETAMTGITCNVTTTRTVTEEEGESYTEETTASLTVGNDTNQITVENPFMTQTRLDSIWLDVANYTYSIGECSFFGGLLVEPGDVLTVENRAGTLSSLPVMAVELSLDGGCKAKISAYGQGTTQASAGGYLGPTEKKIEALKSSVSAERTAREQAVANLATRLGESSTGLYQTTETQEDGSNIYYLHDQPTLSQSALVIKLTAGGIGISQDGGNTFPYGFDFVTGDAIAETIYAGAAWIEQLFATEITATNLHITGNSTFSGKLEVGVVTTDNLSDDTKQSIISTDTIYYLATSASSGVTTSTAGWTTTAQSVTSSKRYLWTYHKYTYADGSSSDSEPVITGVYGETGATGNTGAAGNGISSIVYYYVATASQTAPAASAVTSTSIPSLSATNKYLWQKEVITYTNGTNKTTVVLIAVYGDTGAQGVSISSVTPLYYCSSSATKPAKPTSAVTANSASTYNAWNKAVATYTSTYKYYFTCSEILYSNATRTWSDVVADNGLATANANAADAKTTAQKAYDMANGKNTVYYSKTQPTGDLKSGDTWFNTSNGGIYCYDGTSWVAHKVGTVSIADGVVTADAIIASGVFAKTIYAEGLHLEGEGGAFLQFYDNAILLAGGVDISDAIFRSGTLSGEFEIVSDMLGSIRFDADAFVLDFSDATGNPLCIYGGDIAFSSDSHGIKADTTGSTSTASSSGWLLRGHPVSNTYCCCLGNTSDNTRLYGANLYRSGTSTSISSDRRMKKDFTDLDQRYDSFFKALKPCQFRFLDNHSERLHTGFVAQEVETALEESGIDTKDFAGLVIDSIDEDALAEQGIDINSSEWTDKKQYYLRYEEFIALNTCMIQKLQARVEELENRLAKLEGRNE